MSTLYISKMNKYFYNLKDLNEVNKWIFLKFFLLIFLKNSQKYSSTMRDI